MVVLGSYRRVLSRPGTAAFSASGFLGRLPISMTTLGIVLLVTDRTGSYGLAGATSAALVVAGALAAIPQGRLIDRFGQARVLLPAVVVCSSSLSALVWAVESGRHTPIPQLCAALAGATMPAVGAAVRARWTHALTDSRERQTAFAIEAVVDESVFMVGPPLATLLATSVDPAAGLVAAVITGLVGVVCLVSLRRTEPPIHSHTSHDGGRVAMPWLLLVPVVLISLALGGLFGSAEVVTVAFAKEQGAESLAGVLLAIWAAGSLLAGVASGALTSRTAPAVRMRWGVVALTVLMAPTTVVHDLALMGVLLFLAGFAISPTLIAAVAYVEQTVPAARLTEGLTILQTAMAAGLAPGAAIAGAVIDARGASTAYWGAVGSGLVGVAGAFATRTRRSVGSTHEHAADLATDPERTGERTVDVGPLGPSAPGLAGRAPELDQLVRPGDRTPQG